MKRFEGWYFKHLKGGSTLAIIVGRALTGAFVQVVTDEASYHADYPYLTKDGFNIGIGGSTFSADGISLNIQTDALELKGEINYSGITPLKGDIMGPFRYVPMECRHSVISMSHRLSGSVALNGVTMDFNGGTGYIEGDSGTAFPTSYTWLQCNCFDKPLSLMASIAKIPFMGMRFTGCVCAIWLDGAEYRLATYKGVRIVRAEHGVMELEQGPYRFSAHMTVAGGHMLFAPAAGRMTREIRESAACGAHVRLYKNGKVLFDEYSAGASYEYVTS